MLHSSTYVNEILPGLLRERGMTQQALADASGISRHTVNAYCRGRLPVGGRNAIRLAEALEVPIDLLYRPQLGPERVDRLVAIERRLEAVEAALNGQPTSDVQHIDPEPKVATALAGQLTEYLNENVLDPGNKLNVLDMLDALASLQLRLGLDVDGESAAGYQDALPD